MKDTDFRKPFPDRFPNYVINRLGVVKNIKTGNVWDQEKWLRKGFGYCFVILSHKGDRKRGYIHRLIWRAFKGTIPPDYQIHHLNNISDDNRLSNLKMTSRLENIAYRWRRVRDGLLPTEEKEL